MYLARVLSMMSRGRAGGGLFLSQSVALKCSRTNCLSNEGCDRPVGGDCGGFAGAVCRPDEWCDYPASMIGCGAADEIGTCQPRPTACTFEVTPVCGCDGLTHDNECFANMAGTDVATSGTCASP